jgi:hypothetical protein
MVFQNSIRPGLPDNARVKSDPGDIFDFTIIAKIRPALPDVVKIEKPDRDEMEHYLGVYLAMALEKQYGAEALGWEHLNDAEKEVAAFNVPAPPAGTKPIKLRVGADLPQCVAYVKGLRLKIIEMDAEAARQKAVAPQQPVDVPLPPAMETALRAEFKAYKRMQEEAEYRDWKAKRFAAAAA